MSAGEEETACRFCKATPVALFSLPQGCFCFPDDREQALCPQHVVNAEPIGEMTLKQILDEEGWAWFVASQGR